ncbi:MAG: peptidoglycan-associated lipoprotein Pal [Candidatus Nitricoxidivorans perseverans]|uniref:Peptidoglycan-associated lipoprotein n=1 Tax=Candidatus Nitricoxidivorans perseverans TaxID=2975601 RepID=A0AA49FKN2_9PROT|nr:MAG: peptidoglycan-associated lipoprotein Pal [Candidatus Nitricoxidivorans perseverans]
MRPILPIAASLALLLAACGSQPPASEQTPAGVEDRSPKAVVAEPASVPVPPPAPVAVDPYDPANLKDPKSILSKRSVFFDYDQYVIRDEFKPLVESHAQFLIRNPKMKMLIQGNADERGSREYNLALGQKRAEAVKKALALLGASEGQMESVSLGEEKPRCTEQAEACWAQNRRGDMLYTGEY